MFAALAERGLVQGTMKQWREAERGACGTRQVGMCIGGWMDGWVD